MTDKAMLKVHDKTLDRMKWGPIFNSASRLMLVIGGPLLTAGLMALVGVGAVAFTTAIALTAVGAAVTVAGIGVDYIGTRHSQSGYMDQAEFGAQSTARHLVQELKASNMCMTFEQNARGDGRSWVQATGRTSNDITPTV